jgi:VanZ family protein
MVLSLCWGIYKSNKANTYLNLRYFIIAGLICTTYGIIMEFVQKYYVPNRSFDVGDIIADTVGAAVGTLYSIKRYIKK